MPVKQDSPAEGEGYAALDLPAEEGEVEGAMPIPLLSVRHLTAAGTFCI